MTGQLQKVEEVFLAVMEWRRLGGADIPLSQKLDEICDDAFVRAEVESS
jgi:hypothetical protein